VLTNWSKRLARTGIKQKPHQLWEVNLYDNSSLLLTKLPWPPDVHTMASALLTPHLCVLDEDVDLVGDRFIAQLYKFMDDRGTPINKPVQLYDQDVNLFKFYLQIRKLGGYNKVSSLGE